MADKTNLDERFVYDSGNFQIATSCHFREIRLITEHVSHSQLSQRVFETETLLQTKTRQFHLEE